MYQSGQALRFRIRYRRHDSLQVARVPRPSKSLGIRLVILLQYANRRCCSLTEKPQHHRPIGLLPKSSWFLSPQSLCRASSTPAHRGGLRCYFCPALPRLTRSHSLGAHGAPGLLLLSQGGKRLLFVVGHLTGCHVNNQLGGLVGDRGVSSVAACASSSWPRPNGTLDPLLVYRRGIVSAIAWKHASNS